MKIPKPRQRGAAWRIEMMLDGKRISCTRDTPKECEQWAAIKILEAKTADKSKQQGVKQHYPLSALMTNYYMQIGQHKKSKAYIKEQFATFNDRYPELSSASIHDITPQMLTNWRNSRLRSVTAGTVLREMSLLSAVFSFAQKELFLVDSNPFVLVSKPKQPKARCRRIPQADIDALMKGLEYEVGTVPTEPRHYVAWCFLFALETAMRQGEILGITRSNIHDDYIHLPDTKNGDSRDVPLLGSAIELLKLIDHDGDVLIPHNSNSFKKAWQRGINKTGLDDLHFHDTRHEAITRLVKLRKVPIEILMKITGHKTPSVLINTYYNPTASEISQMLNSLS